MVDGSNTKEGWLYHNLPGCDTPSHRQGTEERAKLILSKLGDVRGKLVLDLGCSVGGISYELARAGAYVEGVDYDETAIKIGNEFKKDKKLPGSLFLSVKQITPQYIKKLSHYDIIIWLSQWQWYVKQFTLNQGVDALFDMGHKAPVLVFESAASDGRAKIEGATQDTIYEWLIKYTNYSKIERIKQDSLGWHDRDLFICKEPVDEWRRHSDSIIKRVDKKYVEKIVEKKIHLDSQQLRDLSFLEELAGTPIVPQIVDVKPDRYVMTYEGNPITKLTDEDIELLLKHLREHKIIHRDIIPSNLLFNGKNVVLIDFAWAIHEGENLKAPINLGEKYKSPKGFDDEYSLRMIQKELNDN